MSSNIGKKGIMHMKNFKKILALAISILMIATMFSIVPMSVSAEETDTTSRLDNWQGNIDVSVKPGDPLYFSTTELYVGDKLVQGYSGYWKTDYPNVPFTVDGVDYTGAITGFNIKTPSGSNEFYKNMWQGGAIDYVLPEAGTYRVVTTMESVKDADGNSVENKYNVELCTFEVKALPRFFGDDIFTGSIDVSVKPGTPLNFSTTDIYVGDKLVQGYSGYWKKDFPNVPFTVDGVDYTGAITDFKIILPSGSDGFSKNMWQGGTIDYILPEAGTYKVVTKMENVKDADGNSVDNKYNVELCTFEVQDFPRITKNLDGYTVFKGNMDISVTPENVDTLTFSNTDDIYVGDKLVKGYGGNWTDAGCQGIKFTSNGVNYTGAVTWLKITAPSGNTASYGVWNYTNAVDYVFSVPGTYKISAKFERVKNEAGESAADIDNIPITTLTVKDLPRLTYTTRGEVNYAGTKNVTVTPTTTLELSTYDLYVGDKLVQGYNGYWSDKKTVQFELDGVTYQGNISHLHIKSPSGGDWYKNMYWGGAIDYVLSEAGTYTFVPSFEQVTTLTGESHDNVYDFANWATFEVKACPHNYELTETVEANCNAEGYDLYTCSYCGATEKRNIVEITGEHNFEFTETVEPTCTAKGYDLYTCAGCGSTEKQNETEMADHDYALTESVEGSCTSAAYDLYTCSVCGGTDKQNVVVAPGHDLANDNGTVTCANCDYSNTYAGEATTITYSVNDATGLDGYTNVNNISAFVGDTLINDGGWWANHTFSAGELSGKVYNAWVVKGDLDYFNSYREARLENGDSYVDENVTYVQVGYGNTKGVTLDKAGTYIIVAALQCYEGSNFLTNIEPIVIGTVEVFDVPVEEDVVGDIDGDTEITAGDLVALQQHVLGIATIEDTTVADINKDGIIDAVDIVMLQLKVLGY